MKGMQKISRGDDFSRVFEYVFNDKAPKFLGASDCVVGSDRDTLIREFRVTCALRPDCPRPVWHQSLRLVDGETVTHQKQLAIALDYMRRMDFDTEIHKYVIVAHGDGHVHIVANRIGLDAILWYGRQENLESTVLTQALEVDHGLVRTKGPEYIVTVDLANGVTKRRLKVPTIRRPKRKELQWHARLQAGVKTPEPLPRYRMVEILERARAVGRLGGLYEFLRVAESAGLSIRATFKGTKVTAVSSKPFGRQSIGFAFELTDGNGRNLRLSGSQVGKAFTGPSLLEEFCYKRKRDLPLLLLRREPFGMANRVRAIDEPIRIFRRMNYEPKSSTRGGSKLLVAKPCHRIDFTGKPARDRMHALPGGGMASNPTRGLDNPRDPDRPSILPGHVSGCLGAGEAKQVDGLRRAPSAIYARGGGEEEGERQIRAGGEEGGKVAREEGKATRGALRDIDNQSRGVAQPGGQASKPVAPSSDLAAKPDRTVPQAPAAAEMQSAVARGRSGIPSPALVDTAEVRVPLPVPVTKNSKVPAASPAGVDSGPAPEPAQDRPDDARSRLRPRR